MNKLMGNSSAVSSEQLNEKYARLLTSDEVIEVGFKMFRDVFMFTNKRLILVDVQGLTGKRQNINLCHIRVFQGFHWKLLELLTSMRN